MPRFVLEIGTEEIPPRFFPPALAQLQQQAAEMLKRARLAYREVAVYGTPRRLALVVEDIAAGQAPATREERGPAARVAFDERGAPTPAARGFAGRAGVTPEDLVVRDTEQGKYVFALIKEQEAPAAQALAERLPELITGLSFPKSMRWGRGTLRFGRPIRWLLALVDDEVVGFTLGDLHSDRLTRGHPTLADGMASVPTAGDYERMLEERFVLVEPARRRAAIEQQIGELARAEGARPVDGGLLEETTFLVEWPTAACGGFDPEYLGLPRAVLVEEMQHVQAYFPLENERGELLARFIAIRDGGRDHLDRVLAGWESVLLAKLIDADYFYREDLKAPLAARVDDLKGVVFQERLGSMQEKTERIRRVAASLAEAAGLKGRDKSALDRAASLCKADLTTAMVADLSSLQGLIGREYALASGEPPEVAEAIGEHYRPRFAGDAIPASELGRLLAVADKMDTLAACFAAGIQPTGSADPYGLRREAAGVVAILLEVEVPVSVSELIGVGLSALSQQADLKLSPEDASREAMDFLKQRIETYLRDDPPTGAGVRYDLVEAALGVGFDDIREAAARAAALQQLATEEPEFLLTVIASTRVSNIARGFEGGEVDPGLFEHDTERGLWSAYQEVLPVANRQADEGDYGAFFRSLGRLRTMIDRYFDDVLVMAEKKTLRRNRLATCWTINQLFRRLADFSLVVQA